MNHFGNYTQLYSIFSKIKSYIDNNTGSGTVQSVSINEGQPQQPDQNGNIDLTIPMDYLQSSYGVYTIDSVGVDLTPLSILHSDGSDPIVRLSYLENGLDLPYVKSISVNGGAIQWPGAGGNVDLSIPSYTIEFAPSGGGGDITASIDGGVPVFPDQNGNIDLTIPDTYVKKVTTNKGEVPASSNNINLGELDAVYNIKATKNPLPTSTRPSFIKVKPNNSTVMKVMSDKGSYVMLSYEGVVEAHGQIVIYEKDGFYFIGGKDNAYYITILVQGSNPTIEAQDGTMVTFSRSDFERNIVAKGYIKETMSDGGSWIFIGDFPQLSNVTNTMYLHVISDNSHINMNNIVVYETGKAYITPATVGDYMEGVWMIRDWYENSWVKSGTTYQPTLRLPKDFTGIKTIECRLTSTHLTHDNSDYYMEIQDPYGNTLEIVQMKHADLSGDNLAEQVRRFRVERKLPVRYVVTEY